MSCLGSMSLVDDCILIMCQAGAVPIVDKGLHAHTENRKLIRIGL